MKSPFTNVHKTNQSDDHTPTTSFIRFYTEPNPPGPGIRQLGTPVPQNPLKLFRRACPKPASPAWSCISCRNHNKGSCLHFPSFPLLLTNPGAVLCGPAWGGMSLFPWELLVIRCLFNGNQLLTCWLHHNKICILNHTSACMTKYMSNCLLEELSPRSMLFNASCVAVTWANSHSQSQCH